MSLFGGGLTSWLGYAGIVLLFVVLIHLLVRRTGGWKLLFRRIRRELTSAAHAFYDPVAARLRYRKRVAFLAGLLRSPGAWSDAEHAIGHAAELTGKAEPYGVVVAKDRVGVLVAGGTPDNPLPTPWRRDDHDPRLWWIERSEIAGYPATIRAARPQAPLLVCVGIDTTGRTAVLLDLLAGPTTVSVYGEPRAARAVVQSIAAQLDVRLPAGAVEVADGIHKSHPGMTLAEAVKRLGAWFVIGAEQLAVPLPAGLRLISLGVARGSSRLLEALPDGTLRLYGAADWLRVDPLPLAKAVARSVGRLPAHDFEGPLRGTPAAATTDDLDDLDLGITATGVSARSAADAGTDRKAPSWT
ncbi:hypothetical protein ACQPXM_01765 [Kribbella sp. CA-253562]|uniref:hypothetical protein n=1 Tax=Kribbella sp. CA-253562 TaxID=3239942 RepID=UPI003D912A06